MEHALRIVKCPWEWLSREPGRCCRSREGIVIKMVNKSENKGWRAAVLVRGGRRTNQNKTENQAGRCPELFWQSGFLDGGAKSQLRERLILSLQRHRTIQAALCYLIFIFFIPIFFVLEGGD